MPELDSETFGKIVKLLVPMMAEESRRAVLQEAFFNHDILDQLSYTGSARDFVVRLVNNLIDYGEIEPGKPALFALLTKAKERVGEGGQQQIDALLEKLNLCEFFDVYITDAESVDFSPNDNPGRRGRVVLIIEADFERFKSDPTASVVEGIRRLLGIVDDNVIVTAFEETNSVRATVDLPLAVAIQIYRYFHPVEIDNAPPAKRLLGYLQTTENESPVHRSPDAIRLSLAMDEGIYAQTLKRLLVHGLVEKQEEKAFVMTRIGREWLQYDPDSPRLAEVCFSNDEEEKRFDTQAVEVARHLPDIERLYMLSEIVRGDHEEKAFVWLVSVLPRPPRDLSMPPQSERHHYLKIFPDGDKRPVTDFYENMDVQRIGKYVPRMVSHVRHTLGEKAYLAVLYEPAHGKVNPQEIKTLAGWLEPKFTLAERLTPGIADFLAVWNEHPDSINRHPHRLIADLLGPRRTKGEESVQARLQRLLELDLGDEPARIAEESFISFGGWTLPNPVTLLTNVGLWEEFPAYRAIMAPFGSVHGDLYGKNILGIDREDAPPQIIDFADYDASQLIFYDYLYLEFDLLYRILPPDDYAARAPLLELVKFLTGEDISLQDDPPGSHDAVSLVGLVRPLRQGVLKRLEKASIDHELAFFVAGVAVGLNFARKGSVEETTRRLGLLYAGAMFRRIQKKLDISYAIDRPFQIFWLELEAEKDAIKQRHQEESRELANQLVLDIHPYVIPDYLYNRMEEYRDTIDHLKEPSARLITIFERHGTGKTALVSHVLKDLLSRNVNTDCYTSTPPEIDNVIYVSTKQAPPFTLEHIFRAIVARLEEDKRKALTKIFAEPEYSIIEKVRQIYAYLGDGLHVLWIDDFEELLGPEGEFLDEGIGAFIREVGRLNASGLRLIITSRQQVESVYWEEIPGQRKPLIEFRKMPLEHAMEMMRALGSDFQVAKPDQLECLWKRTEGNPQAILLADRILRDPLGPTLEELLERDDLFGEHVTEKLLEESYRRLPEDARQVLIALAVFDGPVEAAALQYMPIRKKELEETELYSILRTLLYHRHVFYNKETKRYRLDTLSRDYIRSTQSTSEK